MKAIIFHFILKEHAYLQMHILYVNDESALIYNDAICNLYFVYVSTNNNKLSLVYVIAIMFYDASLLFTAIIKY